MKINKLTLRPVCDKDISLLTSWLNKDYILKWYHDPNEWLAEINERHSTYSWIHHFIVMDGKMPIGFCQYYDCYNANDMEDWYSVTRHGDTFSIDYLIGNEAYLGKGYGKAIISHLINMAFNSLEVSKVDLIVEGDNEAAIKLYLDLGFVIENENRCYIALNF